MTSQEIRQQFFDFFASKEHKIVPSAPVVPYDDPTLLFTNAGMNQFKDVFLGKGTRDYNRAADTQKCIRVSGKHNDLEEVGRDTYHHTFFEMLGNWSFGDPASPARPTAKKATGYYKKEAIAWAWELLTTVWKLPKERLWATVYRTDDEAFELWQSETDINPKHILRFDEKDNFWEMGETGPCGPCSEIHINVSDDYDNPKWVNAGKPECIEIWNLVFIQYNRDAEGTLHELPAKHVDTGMGFERLCAVLQNKKSNYDTDIFLPIIDAIAKISGVEYNASLLEDERMVAMRVIADHVRTLTFAIADGAMPGNEGRGYVLRRILRRAARFGRKLNLNEPFIYQLVDILVKTMGDVFPEIKSNQANVERIIKAEEESFNTTLDRGLAEFNSTIVLYIANMLRNYTDISVNVDPSFNLIMIRKKQGVKGNKPFVYPGDVDISLDEWDERKTQMYLNETPVFGGLDAFFLYDTFGFPLDLTMLLAREKGFIVDENKFNELMNEQKERARKSTKDKMNSVEVSLDSLDDFDKVSDAPTVFAGYSDFSAEAKVVAVKHSDDNTLIVLDRSPFYAESGGQIDDHGYLLIGDNQFKIVGLKKINNQLVHFVENKKHIAVKNGDKVNAVIDDLRRWDIMRNHSATHLLHAALRKVLGEHVHQSGSYVGPDRLRFDFTHFEKVNEKQLTEIETIVNSKIRENLDLQHHKETLFEDAKKMGALMFFGDKYGDKVNIVQFGDFTLEFCGGTHVKNTSQIGLFKIVNESSIASGVRRIEAVTGAGVEKYLEMQEKKIEDANHKIENLLEEKKKLEKELAELKLQDKLGGIDDIIKSPADVNGIKIFKGKVDASNMDELKSMGDELREKMKSGVGMLISAIEDKVGIVVVVSDDLMKKIPAGKIVGEVAKIVGGGGGGRPHMATAGGKDIAKIDDALSQVDNIVSALL